MSYEHVVLERQKRLVGNARPRPARWMFGAVAVGVAIGCLSSTVATARAELLAYEGFGYATGTGVLVGGGSASDSGWSGPWNSGWGSSDANISAGSLLYPYLQNSGNSVTIPAGNSRTNRFPDTSAGGTFDLAGLVDGTKIGADGETLYLSFLQRISSVPAGAFPYYVVEISKGNGNNDRMLLIGHDNAAASPYYVAGTPANSDAVSLAPENADANLFVVKFTFDATGDLAEIYRNPSLGIEPVSPTATLGGAGTGYDFAFDRIALARFGSQSSLVDVDEIRFGTTYADVTPIPEPVSGVLLIGGGLGFLLIRGGRRRRHG